MGNKPTTGGIMEVIEMTRDTSDLIGMDKIPGRPVKLNLVSTDEVEKKLVPIGDLHYGAPNCDVEKVKRELEYCRQSNAWILLMGDLFEAATRASVGAGVYEQVRTPQEQLDDLVDIFEPYADLIIGSHIGNHEFRILKDDGVNMMKIFCKMLHIRYLGYSINHVLKVQGQRYVVYSTHGSSGATLRHTKIKKVLDIANWNNADLYLYAHTHSIDTKTDEYRTYDSKNKVMTTKKRYFCLTGSFLTYDGSYADMKNYQPEKTGVVKIKLFGDRHDIHIST
jgi:hypothetical protein